MALITRMVARDLRRLSGRPFQLSARSFAEYQFDDSTPKPLKSSPRRSQSSLNSTHVYNAAPLRWPRTLTNTGLCVCPEGEMMVIERFGKLERVQAPGLFFAIPIVDRISYIVDMRETALEVVPQRTITKDNVSIAVSGYIYVQFTDARKAAYGSSNPMLAVTQFAQSTMRSAIGDMELDEILHDRNRLNQQIKEILEEGAEPWGLKILRYELTEVTPAEHIQEAMEKQAAAERVRREKVLMATGTKNQMELESEGQKQKLINESEGMLIQMTNEAKSLRIRLEQQAAGEAEAIRIRAEAQADALRAIAKVLHDDKADEAAKIALAEQYIKMYGEMGSQSNTMLFQEKPADVTGLLAQAATILNANKK